MKPKKNRNRDGSRFMALPHVVLDSPAYLALSFSARALLVDIGRQYSGGNNGRLLICDRVAEASRVEQFNHDPQGKTGTDRRRIHAGNPQGPEAKQGKLVCADLACTRLVAGDGHQPRRLLSWGLHKNKIRPPENGVGACRIATEIEVGHRSTTSKNEAMRAIFALALLHFLESI